MAKTDAEILLEAGVITPTEAAQMSGGKAAAPSQKSRRPTIVPTHESAAAYLDWIANLDLAHLREAHLKIAELHVRILTTEAQGKATQHTLVEDGTISPPPSAS